ncbi:MAG: TIGR02757 family protein [Planctomycetota bacterium]
MVRNMEEIKEVLERLYARYNHAEFVPPDPLQFVYKYTSAGNREIAAFLSAALAYGRVGQIEKNLAGLFEIMDPGPYEFVIGFDKDKRRVLRGFKHRFNTGADIAELLELLQYVLSESGSIEKYFLKGFDKTDGNIISALTVFVQLLLDRYRAEHGRTASRTLRYLLVSPSGGSACKRLNLFLRWMVRDDEVDTGLWKSVKPSQLVVPVDVHMGRLCGMLGFCEDQAISLKTALQITAGFAQIVPDDPARYDFALSRVGILENCSGKVSQRCRNCELWGMCQKRFCNIGGC